MTPIVAPETNFEESFNIATEKLHTYCAMCTSRCGVVATVEDGKLTQVNADPAHPNGCICVKGAAAPEIVYSPDRVQYPMVRTRPKGDPDPGWVRITWDQALNLVALRLTDIKDNYGPEAVVFSRATTAGSAAIDFDGWLQRLANAFGSPNLLTSNHICTWNRRVGSKYTYGTRNAAPRLRQYPMHAALGHQSNGHLACAGGANQSSQKPRRKVNRHRSAQNNFGSKGRLLAAREARHRRRAGDGDDPRASRRKSFRRRIRAQMDQRNVFGALR